MAYFQFRNVEEEEYIVLYCSLGTSRANITVSELLKYNHDLDQAFNGPNDRY